MEFKRKEPKRVTSIIPKKTQRKMGRRYKELERTANEIVNRLFKHGATISQGFLKEERGNGSPVIGVGRQVGKRSEFGQLKFLIFVEGADNLQTKIPVIINFKKGAGLTRLDYTEKEIKEDIVKAIIEGNVESIQIGKEIIPMEYPLGLRRKTEGHTTYLDHVDLATEFFASKRKQRQYAKIDNKDSLKAYIGAMIAQKTKVVKSKGIKKS